MPIGNGDVNAGRLPVTAAIAIHNVSEGLAIGLVMVPRGTRLWVAVLWSIVSSLPQPLMAVPSLQLLLA